MKFEDAGKDDFVLEIASRYPECKFVASHRSIEKTINSHFNIQAWGHSIDDVLFQYSACLTIYEELFALRRFYLIDVDRPASFSLNAFTSFMGGSASEKTHAMVAGWMPVNDLAYQISKAGKGFNPNAVKVHPALKNLRQRHFWIDDAESRYQALIKGCNSAAA
ncbi:hypothetical protein ABIE69_002267 [Rhodobacteraceae bacterium MBR-64]